MPEPRNGSSSAGRDKYAQIGNFVVGSEIGKGSFAQVYMGWHKVSRAAVAIKSVEMDRLNKKLKENLYGEIQILKTLRHPHIVALHDCVESKTHINLVMEYCELGDLSFFIKKRDKHATHPATYDLARKYPCPPNSGLNEVVIRHFLKQLASALKFLREMNYVHRDVKPQNLLLLPSPEYRKIHPRDILEASQDSLIPIAGLLSLPMLKLADFGFARVLPSTSLADTLCGSPLYMAPEILRYERYDAKADLWSIAASWKPWRAYYPAKPRLTRPERRAGHSPTPNPQAVSPNPPRRLSDVASARLRDNPSSPPSSLLNENNLKKRGRVQTSPLPTEEQEKAAQEIAFERDYVVVEKRQVEVNAFADEMAANPRLANQGNAGTSPKSGQMVRRGTQTSSTGAGANQQSRAIQIAQGKGHHVQQGSYDKGISGPGTSPISASSAISKAIQDASLRLFGFKMPPARVGKGQSPPLYSPFPAYPLPSNQTGLLEDGKRGASSDEDARVAQTIEDYANRSDCVYGFAEVKFKQLFPLAPSVEHGLGGASPEEMETQEDGLTVDAVVTLSEEALVLYVKGLSMLAKAMDIAGLWWQRKTQREPSPNTRETQGSQILSVRINSAVQWVRARFNEVLEKTEVVRLKLVDAQKQLPTDHPSHPRNHGVDSSFDAGDKQVYLTPGISAEKLMYDRAIDMSRTAAIDEIANEHLADCEAYYITAIRMLEAVLDVDDDSYRSRSGSTARDTKGDSGLEVAGDLDSEDRKVVKKMIALISGRLTMVRKKRNMIAEAEKAQITAGRRRSGDMTPKSVRSHASS
ncbi:unnamed protein product [Parascedosporium putredinis]|uniref:non-specific serine/threonine protein kinase n=1 Tax=Parascedosporium putredinis TaxID=1442378 RepID=A0A9P1HAQ6_9PEZI|nr:unnamed protein product [Parascedosporium putredinis]CAI8003101.1 unnamed protein product [Parascedosporium putredinis]